MESISLGNVLTIIVFVVGLAIHLIVVTASITKWKTETTLRMENFEKTIATIMSTCSSCYLKGKYEEMNHLVTDIKAKQDERIVTLPLQLEAIWKELKEIKSILNER